MKKKKLRKRLLVLLVVFVLIVVPTWCFLDSIHYRVVGWINSLVDLPPDVYHVNGYPIEAGNLFVKDVYCFVDDHPNFFEDYTGIVYKNVDGLEFEMKEIETIISPEGKESNENKKDLYKIDTSAFYGKLGGTPKVYKDGIVFWSMESVFHIYSRTGKPPKKLIDSYWAKHEFVQVTELAKGWYEIHVIG